MSDFLITLGGGRRAEALLALLRKPYQPATRTGVAREFPWGSVAVLHDPIHHDRNVLEPAGGMFAWVGEWVGSALTEQAANLQRRIFSLRDGVSPSGGLTSDPSFAQLNGAFGMVLADAKGPAVISDLFGSVPLYVGSDSSGALVAMGTHPDLVAAAAGDPENFDPISVFEFLHAGTPCYPQTMHRHVRELRPGAVTWVHWGTDGKARVQEQVYWEFPMEYEKLPSEADLAVLLRDAFRAAVVDRCRGEKVAVTLSGGMDSRFILACVPEAAECMGYTFCDVLNREARFARKVAECYGRPWKPLLRDPDYVGRTATQTAALVGCECDWVDAHGMGFAPDFAHDGMTAVFTGLLMNNNLRGYYSGDVHRVARGGGLLPPTFKVVPYDWVQSLRFYRTGVYRPELLEQGRERRRAFLSWHPGPKRQSVAEWLEAYPLSQGNNNAPWMAERRVMPLRLVALDRRLIDVACRIPMIEKMKGGIFGRMAVDILGKGAQIPNANDGVRPGSSHWWRLVQRGLRKVENHGRKAVSWFGRDLHVPHSWHDYQKYWRESPELRRLAEVHGPGLAAFSGSVFVGEGIDLLRDRELNWKFGFRLVQLAVWRSLVQSYR